MRKLIEKLFCSHSWETHVKETYEWAEKKVVPFTENWFRPQVQEFEFSETVEILICKKCGKIKKIKY